MREYLTKKINPVFERLIVDLLIDMPTDFVHNIINYFNNKSINFSQLKKKYLHFI